MNKYEELYRYTKKEFDSEVSKFSRLDDKASKYLSVISVLVAAFGYSFKLFWVDERGWVDGDFVFIRLASLFFMLCLGFSLSRAWYFAFKAIKVKPVITSPIKDGVLKLFDKHNLSTIYYTLTRMCIRDAKENRKVNENTSEMLGKSYDSLSYAFVFFNVLILLYVMDFVYLGML